MKQIGEFIEKVLVNWSCLHFDDNFNTSHRNGIWKSFKRGVELTNGRGDIFYIRNDVRSLYQLSTFTNDATTGTPATMFNGFYIGSLTANQAIGNPPKVTFGRKLNMTLCVQRKAFQMPIQTSGQEELLGGLQ